MDSRCQVCNGQGSLISMGCGHAYHLHCIKNNIENCQFQCRNCKTHLVKAVEIQSKWYICVDTCKEMHCLFCISPDAKLEEIDESLSRWHRDNGRLTRRVCFNLNNNICVS